MVAKWPDLFMSYELVLAFLTVRLSIHLYLFMHLTGW